MSPSPITPPSNPRTAKVAAALSGVAKRPVTGRADEAFDKEVDEELQRERMAELWEQYSGYILAGAIAIVLGVGGYKLLESRRMAAAEADGARYSAAVKQLTDGQIVPGTDTLAAISKGSTGFATLARLRLAGADVATGKPADALAKYEQIARTTTNDPLLADFARLQSAMLTLDTASATEIEARLATLTADTNPWRHNAREIIGMAALKANKRDDARVQFEKLISDQSVPAGIAERARIVMGSIAGADLAAKGQLVPSAMPTAPAAVPAPQSVDVKAK